MVQSPERHPEGTGSLWTMWLIRTIAHELMQTVRPRVGGEAVVPERLRSQAAARPVATGAHRRSATH